MKTVGCEPFYQMKTVPLTLLLLFLTLHISVFAQETQPGSQDSQPEPSIRLWMGPDGHPLPFSTDDEVCDFLKSATVNGILKIQTGVTKPKKVLLEKEGVKAQAIFHYLHSEGRQGKLDGAYVKYIRDSYLNQVAAYEMSRLLGMTNLPPTVIREVNGKEGSVQLWIENAMTEKDRRARKLKPLKPSIINLYAHDMRVFDYLINNIDRHLANILYDPNWQLWLIDHTRAFGRDPSLLDKSKLRRCSRSLWIKLQSLDDALISQTLEPYMGRKEINALLGRREKLIKWLKKKIEKEGEGEVLFGWGSLPPSSTAK